MSDALADAAGLAGRPPRIGAADGPGRAPATGCRAAGRPAGPAGRGHRPTPTPSDHVMRSGRLAHHTEVHRRRPRRPVSRRPAPRAGPARGGRRWGRSRRPGRAPPRRQGRWSGGQRRRAPPRRAPGRWTPAADRRRLVGGLTMRHHVAQRRDAPSALLHRPDRGGAVEDVHRHVRAPAERRVGRDALGAGAGSGSRSPRRRSRGPPSPPASSPRSASGIGGAP